MSVADAANPPIVFTVSTPKDIRRDLHNDLRDFEKEKLITEDELRRGEDELQKLTDRFVEDVNRHGQTKEKEIMEV